MQPGPPVDNMCGPFAAFMWQWRQADIQPGVGSVERTHMESSCDISVDRLIYKHLDQGILSCTRKHTGWGQSSDEI